jgi:hypothetical protein
MKNNFKKSASVISRNPTWLTANSGLLIAAPESDKSIVIYDVLVSSSSGKLGTSANGAGTYLSSLKQGANSFGIPVFSPKGQGVYTDISGYITVTYAVVDAISASLVSLVTSGGTTTTETPASTLSFAAATSSITEGDSGVSYHSVTVNRGGNTSGTATVDYATGNVTANAGTDYTAKSGTLSFAAGVTAQSFLITIAGDTDNENDETFNITLSNPTQTVGTASITGTNPHVVTITNNDTSTIGFSATTSSVSEGASGTSTHTIAVTRSDTNGTATVDYATANGTATAGVDYTATNGTLSFANGVSSMNVSVTISGDATVESDETFTVTLTNAASQYGAAALGTSTHTVTITNDDVDPSNVCVEATSSNYVYFQADTTFVPVSGGNATHNGKTQYTNGAPGSTTELFLTYDSTNSLWKINDGADLGGSDWYESDDDGTDPWDAAWTNSDITVTEKASASHCYPTSTSNFCIAGQAYYPELEGTWVPYHTYNGKAVWFNQGVGSMNLFMWYDSSNTVWKITDSGWEPHEDNGYGSSYGIESDGDGATPWDADWTMSIGSYFDSIDSGDC